MPVETKVKASSAAAAASGLALWALGRYVFKGSVPDVVASWVYVIVPAVITLAAGYLAKHTAVPAVPAAPPAVGGYPAGGTPVSELPKPPPAAQAPPVPGGM